MDKINRIYFWSLQILWLFLTVNLQAQEIKSESKIYVQIDSIFSDFNDINKPGLVIAIEKNGKIIFSKGYGSANLEYNIPFSPTILFPVASVSKQFTVFSILLLAEQGKLSLDDDVRKYIPELSSFGETITLRHLASHTSGLRDQIYLLPIAGWKLDDVITQENVLTVVLNQKELNFKPGDEFAYSNSGFTLLAEVVSRISGKLFAEYTQENIFEPLNMTNTFFKEDYEKVIKNVAYSYYIENTEYKKSGENSDYVGASGMYTTVNDLSLWSSNFSKLKIGSTNIINQMNTLAVLNDGSTFGGAYGQFVSKYKGLELIDHSGVSAAFRAYLGRFPKQNISIMIFSNYISTNPKVLAMKVADVILKDKMDIIDIQSTKRKINTKKITKSELEKYTGNYWNEKGNYARKIYVKNDTLMYYRAKGNESPLVPIDNNRFQMLDVNVDVKVKFEIANEKNMVLTVNNGNPIISESYIPLSDSDIETKQFIGTYYSDELQTTYNIVIKNNKLIIKQLRIGEMNLMPIKQDVFSVDKWFIDVVEFERNSKKEINGFRISNRRAKNIKFTKETYNK